MNFTDSGGYGFGVERRLFGWLDYSVFMLMLAVSTGIGIYFGCFGSKQKTTVDYLLGGKTMSVIPVAVSLVATLISGITMMGVPAEIYVHGSMYWFSVIGAVFTGILNNFIFLPVFFGLQLTSTFEYLERRFNQKIRMMASVLSTISILLYIPIVVYVPALAFSSVSGLSVHIISPLVCIICIFYTMLGGLKAVIWTDFIQGFLIFGSSIVIIVLGIIKVGGFWVVWERGVMGERIQPPSFDPDPFIRNTVWTTAIGQAINWLAQTGINQGFVVKYLSLPSLREARWALVILVLGVILMKSISTLTGFIIYATYYECDPLATKAIHRPDQLLPYYVMDIASSIPGLPGIFIAGIFSAALSTLSSCLNSLSGTIYEDLVHPLLLKGKVSEDRANVIMKIIVVVVGTICVLMVLLVEQLGTVLELAISAGSITYGALLGLFTLGVFFPWANVKGAMAGSISGLLIVGWLVAGSQMAIKDGSLSKNTLPSSVEGCGLNITLSTSPPPSEPPEPPFILYRIAFYYFTIIGTLIVIIVGMVVSYLTDLRDPADMEVALFAPVIQKYIQRKRDAAVKPTEKEMLNFKVNSQDDTNPTEANDVSNF